MKYFSKLAIIALIIYSWFPSGDPTDLFVTGTLISMLGLPMYLAISFFLAFYLFDKIPGKNITAKVKTITSELKSLV